MLAGQTSRSVEAINLVLEELANKIASGVGENDHMLTHAGDEEKHRYLKLRLSRLPAAEGIAIVNSNGRIVNLTRSWPTSYLDVSDRDYFQAVKVGTKDLVISEPVANRVNKETLVFFARRVETLDRRFPGCRRRWRSPCQCLSTRMLRTPTSMAVRWCLLAAMAYCSLTANRPNLRARDFRHQRPGTRSLRRVAATIDRQDISMGSLGKSWSVR